MTAAIDSLPATLLAQLESTRPKDDGRNDLQKEGLKDAITKLLDETEQRAQARERRLQDLLAEVSDQLHDS